MIIGSIAEELSFGYNTWPTEAKTQVAEAPHKQWRKKVRVQKIEDPLAQLESTRWLILQELLGDVVCSVMDIDQRS